MISGNEQEKKKEYIAPAMEVHIINQQVNLLGSSSEIPVETCEGCTFQ